VIGGELATGALILPDLALGVFVAFCRVGGCLMLAPGFSSQQIPVQVRLFIALAATLALAPLVLDDVALHTLRDHPASILRLTAQESLIGAFIGLLARLFFMALETLAFGLAIMLGFSNPFGVSVESDQAMPPLATLVVLSATALVFFADLHWEALRGLAASYRVTPLGAPFNPQFALRHIVDILGEAFRIALRVASPFFIYAILANLAMSIINRLTPQVAVFYMATPFIIGGGVVLLYFTIRPLLDAFLLGFGGWLVSG
jgi:flagellar biosynthetic protein FliR